MKILMIGDVTGVPGCNFLQRHLHKIRKRYNIDFVVANGENSAKSNGISPESAKFLFGCGVDFITTGNHVFKQKEICSYLEESAHIIRPANLLNCRVGKGYEIYESVKHRIGIINLQGTVYMNKVGNPFHKVEEILKEMEAEIILVDFHAEATSEKRAMGYFLDGKVTAVVGSHTHVLTEDGQILPKGTGYITDIGMTGPIESILGVEKEIIIERFYHDAKGEFRHGTGPCMLNGVMIELNQEKQVKKMEAIVIKEDKEGKLIYPEKEKQTV